MSAVTDDEDVVHSGMRTRLVTNVSRAKELTFTNMTVIEVLPLATVEVIAALHNAVDVGIELRVECDVEGGVRAGCDEAFGSTRSAKRNAESLQADVFATDKGKYLHPASHAKRSTIGLDAQSFATSEVEAFHVWLLRLEQIRLHLQPAPISSINGASLNFESGFVFQLISAGREDERCVWMLAAIGSGTAKGCGIVFAVIGNGSEVCNGNASSAC